MPAIDDVILLRVATAAAAEAAAHDDEGVRRAFADTVNHMVAMSAAYSNPYEYDTSTQMLVAFVRTCERWSGTVSWGRATLADLGVDYDRYAVAGHAADLLAMSQLHPQDAYRLAAPGDFPPSTHRKPSCGHKAVWDEACRAALVPSLAQRIMGRQPDPLEARRSADLAVANGESDLRLCGVHAADWTAAHEVADHLVQSLTLWTERAIHAATDATVSDPQQRLAVLSLLLDPIVWAPGWDKLGDGTHRVCAARLQQVPNVVYASPPRRSETHEPKAMGSGSGARP